MHLAMHLRVDAKKDSVLLNTHLPTTWDKAEALQGALSDMHCDLESLKVDTKISFTLLGGDVSCEWPPGRGAIRPELHFAGGHRANEARHAGD